MLFHFQEVYREVKIVVAGSRKVVEGAPGGRMRSSFLWV
jgi:hypothetical protein